MDFSEETIEIYVRLLNEGAEVFSSGSRSGSRGLYRLVAPNDYDPDDEEWEFRPGETVGIRLHHSQRGVFNLAVKP
jgi:hypothetical protein